MKSVKDMSLNYKLSGGFGLILLIFFVLVMAFAACLSASSMVTTALGEVDNMCLASQRSELALREYQLTRNPAALKAIESSQADYLKNANSVKSKLRLKESRDLLVKSIELSENYAAAIRNFVAAGADYRAQPQAYAAFLEARKALYANNDYARTSAPVKINALLKKIGNILKLISLFALALGLMLGLHLSRRIGRDMAKSVSFVRRIADGDLLAEIDIDQQDEIGQLAEALRGMAARLDEMARQIRLAAEDVARGTAEVHGSSEQLARSANDQAASVEEIAATIEEMTSSLKAAAMSAEDGRVKALSAIGLVNENVGRSREMASAMDEITAAAGKIRDITATVNEVAFQTNLLALNAAVEAARAGEHGKGFAVVAEEVRALAQRSAGSSREIRDLIETTIGKVQAGSQIVSQVAAAMEEINLTTLNLSQAMEEIAAANAEQASGVDELNRAIAQVDNGTQGNAAIVEELASNATAMQVAVGEMTDAVRFFKTSGAAAAVKQPGTLKSPAAPKVSPPARPTAAAAKSAPAATPGAKAAPAAKAAPVAKAAPMPPQRPAPRPAAQASAALDFEDDFEEF